MCGETSFDLWGMAYFGFWMFCCLALFLKFKWEILKRKETEK